MKKKERSEIAGTPNERSEAIMDKSELEWNGKIKSKNVNAFDDEEKKNR